MSPFDWLLLGHLIGDYLFQTNWMAMRKEKEWLPLLSHCFVYTLIVGIIGYSTHQLTLYGILFIFVTHIVIDRRSFIRFWVRTIQGAKGGAEGWLSIVTDQIFHLIILAIALYIR
jgi:hypothetical protein